ncbi:HAAS domain-containing protein [Alkalihalobacterium bogoriense]|uniref:HAAS domain-containing protein n=1 Tax=Alkalihalobacterium bogoriense TaxID=246272 RepID=UPI00047AAAF6|nr:hypothetical protein [Alkalihalobacterium bogoriense]
MGISVESREFLQNLRLYLISSGKNENEIEEIIGELEDHFQEAERDGKSVEDIIGKTPKEYMEELAGEMPIDVKGLLKFVPIVFVGAISYIVMGDAIRGELEYSVIQLIGYPVVFLISMLLTLFLFKYIASTKVAKVKEWFLFFVVGGTPLVLFVALIFLNRGIDSPTVQIGSVGSFIAVALAIIVFIGISIWSKSWIAVILPTLLFLPEFIITHSDFHEDTKIMLSGAKMVAVLVVFLIMMRLENKKAATGK